MLSLRTGDRIVKSQEWRLPPRVQPPFIKSITGVQSLCVIYRAITGGDGLPPTASTLHCLLEMGVIVVSIRRAVTM